jgi:hypothetical protein
LRPMTARPVTPMLAFLLIRILSKSLSIQSRHCAALPLR